MSKILFTIFLFFSFLNVYTQNYNSWDSQYIKRNSKLKTLNIFINVIYDVNPQYNTYPSNDIWIEAYNEGINNESIPPYLLDLFDTVFNPLTTKGTMTRLYQESSFDSLQITGDFVVVNINESSILSNYSSFNIYDIINASIDLININGLQTLFGNNSFEDYFYSSARDSTLSFVIFMVRNITDQYGGLDQGQGNSGFNYNDLKRIKIENAYYKIGHYTKQCVATSNIALSVKSITTHEIAHQILGTNAAHSSGGNHYGSKVPMPFFTIQGGYGLMGSSDGSLVSTNGFERWRMHWKNPASPYYISAKDTFNNNYLSSDISKSDGNISFILRDFITTGDVIRIKLPYKDSQYSSNQYIWLENHQIGKNNKLDFLMYSNAASCRPKGIDGIYSYYQVGRDILTGSNMSVNPNNERDNLKIIPAEGYWNFVINNEIYPVNCIAGGGNINYTHSRYSENPFNGNQDQERTLFPPDNKDTLKISHVKMMWRKKINESINDSLPRLGDNRDAFHNYSKINMGTNPSTCNTKTFYNALFSDSINGIYIDTVYLYDTHRNNQTTYLTGLSIEMIPLPDSTYRVNLRWDDFDVRNNAIWTGNICLKESLFLNSGKTIYLIQNKTVALPFRNPETGYFADFTNFRCDTNSKFVLNPNATLFIDEKSIFNMDSSSSFVMMDSSLLHITNGSSFYVKKGSNFKMYDFSQIIVDSLSILNIYDTIKIAPNAKINIKPGGKLVVVDGVLKNLIDSIPWQGIIVEGTSTQSQMGVTPNQGIVILNGATIENAICGVKVGDPLDPSKNGGIVYAYNTDFKNCKNGVSFAPYKNMNNNLEFANRSKFTDCDFIIDNDFNNTGLTFNSHVQLLGVNGITFTGCRFTNSRTTYNPPAYRYASSGISAFNSGFKVQPKCLSNLIPGEICTQNDIDIESIFTGLDYGIVVQGCDNFYKISVLSTKFISNDYGIYLSGVNNAKILNNSFSIGKNNYNLVSNPVGLFILGGSGFRIEENEFLNNSFSSLDKIGIRVKNTGKENNQIYKNLFVNLTYGQLFDGINYSTRNPSEGLVSLCNENQNNVNNDFWVRKIDGFDFNGINQHQGVLLNTGSMMQIVSCAGNTFSTSPLYQYQNDGNYLYYLQDPNYSSQILSIYSSNIDVINAPENPCPSKINALNIQTIESELSNITLNYGNLKYNYNELIDAGNTEELLQLIQGEWSEDVWELRTELLGQSPYLSQESLLSVADENLLPPALFLEICLANPDATKDEKFLDHLRYEIPNPLPEYMINLIQSSWDEKTLRTELEEQLSAFKTYRDEYQNYKTEFLFSDTVYNYTDIINHIGSRGSYSDYFSLAEIALSQDNFEQANLYLDILEYNTEKLSSEEVAEVSSFRDYIAIRETIFLDSTNIYNLDSTQIAALEIYASSNNYRGAILARNILCFLYNICIEDVPAPPKMLRVGTTSNADKNTTPYIASVKVLPNPANTYASFFWDMKSYNQPAILYIYDQTGKTVMTKEIANAQGQWIWDLKNTSSGVYLYTLKSDQLILFSGKVIVNK